MDAVRTSIKSIYYVIRLNRNLNCGSNKCYGVKKHVLSKWRIYALDWTSADPQRPFPAFRPQDQCWRKSLVKCWKFTIDFKNLISFRTISSRRRWRRKASSWMGHSLRGRLKEGFIVRNFLSTLASDFLISAEFFKSRLIYSFGVQP